jgi:hypothetical protein
MKIFIKNMVCNRCIAAVENIFNTAGIKTTSVILGEVETESDIPADKMLTIEENFSKPALKELWILPISLLKNKESDYC